MPPITLLIKPASGSCNMKCKYCFYRDEMENRDIKSFGFMTEKTLYSVLKRTFDYAQGVCSIAFQGGEPTLIGLDYFESVVKYVSELNTKNCKVNYALQTNGYKLNDRWVKFFKKNNFLIGISLDGTQNIHDKYRTDMSGGGTFNEVMQTIQLLKEYDVDFNILTVITSDVSKHAGQVYDFLKKNNMLYQQYIECLDPIGEIHLNKEYSLSPKEYGKFLVELFDRWYNDILNGKYVYIQYFENIIGMLRSQPPQVCTMLGVCATYLVVEADGSVYPCDFYALDEWKLGNFIYDDMKTIEKNRTKNKFVEYSKFIPNECKACKWYTLCRNGCRRNCEPVTEISRNRNYFCKSYKQFFNHSYKKMLQLSKTIGH